MKKNKYEGKKWCAITKEEQNALIEDAFPVSTDPNMSTKVSSGKCVVTSKENTLAIQGEVINGKIHIDDDSVFFNPIR